MLVAPAQAGAAAIVEPCEAWTGEITSITATGPGTVSVIGVGTPIRRNGRPGPCAYPAYLAGHVTERMDRGRILLGAENGRAPLPMIWPDRGMFRQQLSLAVGTGAVCMSGPDALGITCDEVTVGAEKDGSPSTPVVGRQFHPMSHGGGDICGNCVSPPKDP